MPPNAAPNASAISGMVMTHGLSWIFAKASSDCRNVPWKVMNIRRKM